MRVIIQLFRIQWHVTAFLLLFVCFGLTACGTDNDDDDEPELEEYSGDFIPSDGEVTTSATGSATATINLDTREVSYDASWADLSSAVIAMHFHDAGPVIHDIEGWEAETSGSVSGSVTFSAQEAADLAEGDVYIQIHTETYPGGEVIAPLLREGSNTNTTNGDDGNGY